MISFKFILSFLPGLLFPLLQPIEGGPLPGDGEAQTPITQGIILLVLSAIGLGIKTFNKKYKK
ncbi:MAG: hypothetical protein HC819_20395 [Cyclobacteriaceae bacterium]|nr:hypothetical protein [Cyclobacteriaceae bacterium]